VTEVLGVFLLLEHRNVVVIGGGPIALQKLRTLVPTGANIFVIGKYFSEDCLQFIKGNKVKFEERLPVPQDFDGAFVTYIATSDHTFNCETAKIAGQRGSLVNVVDDPELCDFFSSSIIRRGPIQIAFSSGGAHPSLAKALREYVENLLPPGLENLAERLIQLRNDIIDSAPNLEAGREQILASIKQFEEQHLNGFKFSNKSEAALE
jgi:siroheme synthase-like protein